MRQKTPCLKFKRLTRNTKVPYRASEEAACLDLFVSETETLYPQRGQEKAYLIHTGIALDIPKGYHAEVYLRSSTGKDTKFRLANGTGIIDNDYTGEVMLLVENIGPYVTRLNEGDRIAQLMLVKDVVFDLEEIEEITKETKRGNNGFGSTGKD